MVVNSFDSKMGFGAANPYTTLARKAMSRHFRCMKDAILAQLKISCELLGEKDVMAASGLSKGETPRLRLLDQSLRQQRALHQMGMMEPEAWRPQRGLPERSVNILRAWLFEHFLHPYSLSFSFSLFLSHLSHSLLGKGLHLITQNLLQIPNSFFNILLLSIESLKNNHLSSPKKKPGQGQGS